MKYPVKKSLWPFKSLICLNHVIKSWHICEELKSIAKCSRFGVLFYRCEDCACKLHIISLRAQISQKVKYWYEICDVLVPILHAFWYQFFTVWNLRNVKFAVQQCFDFVGECTFFLSNEGFGQPVHTHRLDGTFEHKAPVCIFHNLQKITL